ncbi:MAG: hypothetical protein AB1497_01485 [Bacillota bacterium]
MENRFVGICMSSSAILLAIIRIAWPELNIDSVTIALLLVGALPWLLPMIKSVEIPGGWKVEFHEVSSAGEKVTGLVQDQGIGTFDGSYLQIFTDDPPLTLLALRIEMEKRLRALATQHSIPERIPLPDTVRRLRDRGVLSHTAAEGLQQLLVLCRRAARGAEVDAKVAGWAIETGPRILSTLDALAGKECTRPAAQA